MILSVLMNMFELYLSIWHFIVCLHFDILPEPASVRRTESGFYYQG